MDVEGKLAQAWAADAPPAHDAAFAMAVLANIERRRMWSELAELLPLVVVVAVLAWAFAPAIESALDRSVDGLATTAFLVAASILGGIWLAFAALRPNPT